MQIKVKTNSIEPLIEAVLNHWLVADVPNIKDEYILSVTTKKKNAIEHDGIETIQLSTVYFSIEIPRLNFTLRNSWDYDSTIKLYEFLDMFSTIFAANLYTKIVCNKPQLNVFSYPAALDILQPVFDKSCRICMGKLELGQAFKPAGFIPMIEKNGDISTDLTYHSDSVGLVKCKKCKSCGKSFIPPKPAPAGVITIK